MVRGLQKRNFTFKLFQFCPRPFQQGHLHLKFFARYQTVIGKLRNEVLARILFEFTHWRALDHSIELGSKLVERVKRGRSFGHENGLWIR